MDVFGETGGSDVTFDNISGDAPEGTMDSDEISVPEVDLDKQEPAGSNVADETSGETNKSEKQPSKTANGQEPSKEEVLQALKFGEEQFEIAKLLEDQNELGRLQKMLDNGAMMRSDYSKKTAAHAEAVRNWESQKNSEIAKFQNYLQETNKVFNDSPLTFLMNSFGAGPDGNPLPPDQVREHVVQWAKALSGQLSQGDKFDPSKEMQKYELERRVAKMEQEKQQYAEQQRKAAEERATKELSDRILSSALKNFPQDETLNAFVESMPGLKQYMLNAVLDQVGKDHLNMYNPQDETWDDTAFLETYNFGKLWGQQAEAFKKAYGNSYQKYLAEKSSQGKRKPTKSQIGNIASEDKGWTFGRLGA